MKIYLLNDEPKCKFWKFSLNKKLKIELDYRVTNLISYCEIPNKKLVKNEN